MSTARFRGCPRCERARLKRKIGNPEYRVCPECGWWGHVTSVEDAWAEKEGS